MKSSISTLRDPPGCLATVHGVRSQYEKASSYFQHVRRALSGARGAVARASTRGDAPDREHAAQGGRLRWFPAEGSRAAVARGKEYRPAAGERARQTCTLDLVGG